MTTSVLYRSRTREAVLADWARGKEVARFSDRPGSYDLVLFRNAGFCQCHRLATAGSETLDAPWFSSPSALWLGLRHDGGADDPSMPKALGRLRERQLPCAIFVRGEGDEADVHLGSKRPVISVLPELGDLSHTLVRFELCPPLPKGIWGACAGPRAWRCLPETRPVATGDLREGRLASAWDAVPLMHESGETIVAYATQGRAFLEYYRAGHGWSTGPTLHGSDPAVEEIAFDPQEPDRDAETFTLENGEDFLVPRGFTVPLRDGVRAVETFLQTGRLATWIRWTSRSPVLLRQADRRVVLRLEPEGRRLRSSQLRLRTTR